MPASATLSQSLTIGIVTLGCDKNTVDNEYLAGALDQWGAKVVAAAMDPVLHGAQGGPPLDGVLINTCAFVESAKRQSIQSILAWCEHKRRVAAAETGKRCRVFVAGCLSQRYREELVKEMPEVDGFVGVGEWDKIVQLITAPEGTSGPVNLIREMPAVEVRRTLPRLELGPRQPHAYLKIGDGCNHNCAFCAIPSFKGRLRSVPKEILLAEARLLLSRGVREINIVAQDTSDYGKDLYARQYGIAELLEDLARLPGQFWLRLFYFYPGGLTDKFLSVLAAYPDKIVPYLDMPLQHLHPEVLRSMKRPHRDVNTFEAMDRLRKAVPGMHLRTTFITGFPGETQEHFDALLEGVERLRIRRLGAFPYSEEEGTRAVDLADMVPKKVRRQRHDQLMRLQARLSEQILREEVGREITVLVERKTDEGEPGDFVARGPGDAPDVDGCIYIHSRNAEIEPGQFARVKITDSTTYDLIAEA
jgi:ribosomal protein S12 methylthiotransferase